MMAKDVTMAFSAMRNAYLTISRRALGAHVPRVGTTRARIVPPGIKQGMSETHIKKLLREAINQSIAFTNAEFKNVAIDTIAGKTPRTRAASVKKMGGPTKIGGALLYQYFLRPLSVELSGFTAKAKSVLGSKLGSGKIAAVVSLNLHPKVNILSVTGLLVVGGFTTAKGATSYKEIWRRKKGVQINFSIGDIGPLNAICLHFPRKKGFLPYNRKLRPGERAYSVPAWMIMEIGTLGKFDSDISQLDEAWKPIIREHFAKRKGVSKYRRALIVRGNEFLRSISHLTAIAGSGFKTIHPATRKAMVRRGEYGFRMMYSPNKTYTAGTKGKHPIGKANRQLRRMFPRAYSSAAKKVIKQVIDKFSIKEI